MLRHYSLWQLTRGRHPICQTYEKLRGGRFGRELGKANFRALHLIHSISSQFVTFRRKAKGPRRAQSSSSLTAPLQSTIRSLTLPLSRNTCKSVSRSTERQEISLNRMLSLHAIALSSLLRARQNSDSPNVN